MDSKTPVAWTIAGSDSGGGAGIQADLKVMSAFGVHGCSITTALTAQNTLGVWAAEPVSETMLRAQFQALETDLPPAVIKTGMLGSASTCEILAEVFQTLDVPIVCDPVLKSTSGSDLLDPEALDLLKTRVFPKVGMLTPNLPETEKLIGSFQSLEEAADKILELGVQSVLIKGGHSELEHCTDFWTDGKHTLRLASPRIETRHSHGTGCILASAIASAIALGQDFPTAVTTAKTFLNQCLKSPARVGSGHGPMLISPFENNPDDRPNVVGEIGDLTAVGGIDDQATFHHPRSTIPAINEHSHLHRLSRVFVDDPMYFVTTNTMDRQKILHHTKAHEILRTEWEDALDRHGWAIGSYVIMPDHIHFFCKPTHESKSLSKFMQQWKQWTSKRLKNELEIENAVWQPEFFDHLIRSSESYSEKWNYVEQNPVRAGLVKQASNWPFAGHIHFK